MTAIQSIFDNDEIKNSLEKNRAAFLKEQYNIPEEKPELTLKRILD